MRILVLLHRWLGVGFCLLFAMWFASGIVMHFVPFPAMTEAARFSALSPIDIAQVRLGPRQAVSASGLASAQRVRLVQRIDGPLYIVSDARRSMAIRADDGADGSVGSDSLALKIADAHARRRGVDASQAAFVALVDRDQWTVSGEYDGHRPLYLIALNDPAGTELYVSSQTGEVVLETTHHQRAWNYLGSVAHWIYPTILRSHLAAWSQIVWTLSLVALFTAALGLLLGILRLRVTRAGIGSPFRGWQAWHHILGLLTSTFLLVWIFSGWLSMDNGLLFSDGHSSRAGGIAVDWDRLGGNSRALSAGAVEVEWFAWGDRLYRRERTGFDSQSMAAIDAASEPSQPPRSYLTTQEIDSVIQRREAGCAAPIVVGSEDAYPVTSSLPGAPIYRSMCGDVWVQVDGATGILVERLDSSRRIYRWLYTALHTMNFPVLFRHPGVRSGLIVALCAIGFVFSITGAVIGWRRLRSRFPSLALP
jgi:PepSY-associated TM region